MMWIEYAEATHKKTNRFDSVHMGATNTTNTATNIEPHEFDDKRHATIANFMCEKNMQWFLMPMGSKLSCKTGRIELMRLNVSVNTISVSAAINHRIIDNGLRTNYWVIKIMFQFSVLSRFLNSQQRAYTKKGCMMRYGRDSYVINYCEPIWLSSHRMVVHIERTSVQCIDNYNTLRIFYVRVICSLVVESHSTTTTFHGFIVVNRKFESHDVDGSWM